MGRLPFRIPAILAVSSCFYFAAPVMADTDRSRVYRSPVAGQSLSNCIEVLRVAAPIKKKPLIHSFTVPRFRVLTPKAKSVSELPRVDKKTSPRSSST